MLHIFLKCLICPVIFPKKKKKKLIKNMNLKPNLKFLKIGQAREEVGYCVGFALPDIRRPIISQRQVASVQSSLLYIIHVHCNFPITTDASSSSGLRQFLRFLIIFSNLFFSFCVKAWRPLSHLPGRGHAHPTAPAMVLVRRPSST